MKDLIITAKTCFLRWPRSNSMGMSQTAHSNLSAVSWDPGMNLPLVDQQLLALKGQLLNLSRLGRKVSLGRIEPVAQTPYLGINPEQA